MDKDETKEYVDADQYPNQTKGGELSTWQTSKKTPLFTMEAARSPRRTARPTSA